MTTKTKKFRVTFGTPARSRSKVVEAADEREAYEKVLAAFRADAEITQEWIEEHNRKPDLRKPGGYSVSRYS